jgi:glucose-1-phosphate thymidylyltransferase
MDLDNSHVNRKYLENNELGTQIFGRGVAWLDTGTHESLLEASTFIETIERRKGLKVACIEEIAFEQGYISKEQLIELAQPLAKNQYGQYLLRCVEEGS